MDRIAISFDLEISFDGRETHLADRGNLNLFNIRFGRAAEQVSGGREARWVEYETSPGYYHSTWTIILYNLAEASRFVGVLTGTSILQTVAEALFRVVDHRIIEVAARIFNVEQDGSAAPPQHRSIDSAPQAFPSRTVLRHPELFAPSMFIVLCFCVVVLLAFVNGTWPFRRLKEQASGALAPTINSQQVACSVGETESIKSSENHVAKSRSRGGYFKNIPTVDELRQK